MSSGVHVFEFCLFFPKAKREETTLGTTREISSSCLEGFRAGINIANKRADKVEATEKWSEASGEDRVE